MTVTAKMRSGRTAGTRRFAWSSADALVVAGVSAPIVCLTILRGGVAVEHYWGASAISLVAAATALLLSHRAGRPFHLPWPALTILLFPLAQLIPARPLLNLFASADLHQLRAGIARLGVELPATVSVFPLATVQSWIVLAGCVAIFVLTSGLTRRRPLTWPFALAPLIALGLFESVLGLKQYLQARAARPGALAAAQGTFVNRDHFAVLLEACLAIAIGLALAGIQRARHSGWLSAGGALALGGAGLAAASLTAIVQSSSRAAIGIAVLLLAVGFLAAAVGDRRPGWAKRAAWAVAISAVALVALYLTLPAGTAGRFEALWRQRGDPVRFAIWADSARTAQSYFWTGSGLGTYGSVFRRSSFYAPRAHVDHAHSDYLEWLVELGFPATIFLIGVLGFTAWISFQRIREAPDSIDRCLRFGCLLGAAAILLHAMVDFPLRIPALAALFAALLGSASGGRPVDLLHDRRPESSFRIAGAAIFAALAALSLWAGLGNTEPYDAHALYTRAEEASIRGDYAGADTLYLSASRSNPFAAGVWLKRAEAAKLNGDGEIARACLDLARLLEPFTLRTEWPRVQQLLSDGHLNEALPALAAIARAAPELRPGIYASALGAGIPAESAARQIVASESEAANEFIRLLFERSRWNELAPSLRVLHERSSYSPPPALVHLLLDRLFAAGETAAMMELAAALEPAAAPRVAFPWLIRPAEGVSARLNSDPTPPQIEIDFQTPKDSAYGHVHRYFPVDTSQQYMIEAEIRLDAITGFEPLRLAVRTPQRTLSVSPALRGTTPWQTVRLPIDTGPTGRVIRVEVMRPRSSRANDTIRGRLYLRNVRVTERGKSPP